MVTEFSIPYDVRNNFSDIPYSERVQPQTN